MEMKEEERVVVTAGGAMEVAVRAAVTEVEVKVAAVRVVERVGEATVVEATVEARVAAAMGAAATAEATVAEGSVAVMAAALKPHPHSSALRAALTSPRSCTPHCRCRAASHGTNHCQHAGTRPIPTP